MSVMARRVLGKCRYDYVDTFSMGKKLARVTVYGDTYQGDHPMLAW